MLSNYKIRLTVVVINIAIKVNMPPTKHHMVIKHWSSAY